MWILQKSPLKLKHTLLSTVSSEIVGWVPLSQPGAKVIYPSSLDTDLIIWQPEWIMTALKYQIMV